MQEAARKRLLIVDAVDNLDVLEVLLADQYDVTTCTSSAEAVETAKRIKPDLLLLDIAMSAMDGVECLQRIRAVPELGNVPAIAVTALAHNSSRNRCLESGFQEFVSKPILDFKDLNRRIYDLLSPQGS
jgi:CheY-like chemotaxis protein